MTQRTNYLTLTALFAAILAVSSFIRIPAGPVPLTLQSTAALLCGYCLGSSRGAAATLLYTAVGLAGLPVFASGGGPAYLISPTFGYILGFTTCALATGFLARFNPRHSAPRAYLIMFAGLAALYIPGYLWLYLSLHVIMGTPASVSATIQAGLTIPLIGDMFKTIPAAIIAVKLRPVIQRKK
jgi:biotin transport system substrate-specific component